MTHLPNLHAFVVRVLGLDLRLLAYAAASALIPYAAAGVLVLLAQQP